jgi:hypothetical protein
MMNEEVQTKREVLRGSAQIQNKGKGQEKKQNDRNSISKRKGWGSLIGCSLFLNRALCRSFSSVAKLQDFD